MLTLPITYAIRIVRSKKAQAVLSGIDFRKEDSTGKSLLSLSPQVVKVLLDVDYSYRIGKMAEFF